MKPAFPAVCPGEWMQSSGSRRCGTAAGFHGSLSLWLGISAALVFWPMPLHANGGAAIRNVVAPYVGYVTAEAGFAFCPNVNITITNLGYAFDSENGAFTVEIRGASGTPLASATLVADETLPTQFVYTNIPPLNLPAGSTNFVMCYNVDVFEATGTKSWFGALTLEGDPDGGSFDVAPELEYLGAATNGVILPDSGAALALFVGPNFEFEVSTAIQASTLTISLTLSNSVVVTWPSSDTAGQLQAGPDVEGPMTNVLTAPIVVGPSQSVELPVASEQLFFRLIYP